MTQGNLRDRALTIEKIVCEKYCDEDTDAADLALDELHRDSNRTDKDIAYQVAMRIALDLDEVCWSKYNE